MPAKLRWIDTPIASRIFATILTLLASYFGYEKVEEYRAANAPSGDVKVDVKVEAPKGAAHSHGTVLTTTDIKQLIREAMDIQNKENERVFKKKEPWENGG